MTTLNRGARDVFSHYKVHACTDVTGFSLLGHLLEMCSGSEVSAEISPDKIVFLDQALEFAQIGILPEGMYRNRMFAEEHVDTGSVETAVCDLLFDPQTSGGLLCAIDPSDADRVWEDLQENVPCAQRIGTIIPRKDKSIYLL